MIQKHWGCLLAISAFLLGPLFLSAQTHRISGYVADENQEPLVGVTVRVLNTNTTVSTNPYGFYSLTLSNGQQCLFFSYVGSQSDSICQQFRQDTAINVLLKSRLLNEVVISENRNDERIQMSTIKLPLGLVKKMPNLGGESDIMKALSFTPGVTNGSEGSAGLFVRGGTPDQNLILLDNAVVYNPNHLFGFLSVFNTDAIKNVELMKGGFPARYGGRLSSVLDITMKEGSRKKLQGEGGIGLVSSRLLLEGPLFRKRGSFMLAGRAAYLGVLLLPLRLQYNSGGSDDYTTYNMYDLNGKVNFDISDKQKLYFSFYTGQDKFKALSRSYPGENNNTLQWGNITGTMRYTQELSPRLFWKNMLLYSNFKYNFGVDYEQQDSSGNLSSNFANQSGLQNITLKSEMDYFVTNKHVIRFGIEQTLHRFTPRKITLSIPDGDATTTLEKLDKINATESSAYVEDEWRPFKKVGFNYGLRYNYFTSNKSYQAIEPRISGYYQLISNLSLKASYSRANQNVHLLTNSGLGLQNDLWVPSTSDITPQRANQWAIGLASFLRSINTEATIELYYKQLKNQIECKEGVSVLGSINEQWESLIATRGLGTSYGLELGLSKQVGRLTGLFAYTYARSTRTFSAINGGKEFPFKYDFRHNLNATLNFKLNKKWDFSSNLVYHTGQPFSFPVAALPLPYGSGYTGGAIFYYKERNNVRLPDYIRIDVGFNRTKVKDNGRTATWNFSIFNLLNRQNALYAQVINEGRYNYQTKQYEYFPTLRLKSFLPILPSVAYSLKF